MKRKKRVKAKGARKVKHTKKLSLFVVVPLIMVSLFVLAATAYKIVEIILTNTPSTNFPRLDISLTEIPIEQIDTNSKDIKYPNNIITITNSDIANTFEDVEIKGRGNFTWTQIKKPYQIKLPTRASLFNLKEARKWILLANYLDPSHLRTNIAFYLQNILGSPNPVNGGFVEVFIDQNYRGLYYLTEKVEIDKNRIDLKSPSGIVVELDNLHSSNETCATYTKSGDCFVIHDAVNSDLSANSIATFTKKFDQLENAITKKDYSTIIKLVDVDSFAKYFLLSEFSNNPDAYSSSFYLYTDGDKDEIHANAGWDFDLAFSNKNSVISGIDTESLYSPLSTMIFKKYTGNDSSKKLSGSHLDRLSTLLYDLMDIPEFEAKVKETYQATLSGKSEELLDYIKSQAEYIRPAALRDQERWKLKTNFDEEVDYLIDWVAKRYDHFEQTYGVNSN